MKKWIRRLMLLTATMLVVALGGLMLAVYLARTQPAYYARAALTAEQLERAAQSAEDKFIQMQNHAARIVAAATAGNAGATNGTTRTHAVPSTTPIAIAGDEPVTIVFTSAEINSFFDKWSRFQNWKSVYEPYLSDPVIVFEDHRMILAAKLRDPSLVVSLHFDAKIDADGRLDLQLARVMGGRLPLPEALLGKYEKRLTDHVRQETARWQRTAKINARGEANSSAISASMGKLFAHMLNHEPAEPVLFLPVVGQSGCVAVKIVNVEIGDDQIALTVRAMSREEHAELLNRIRETDANVAAIESQK